MYDYFYISEDYKTYDKNMEGLSQNSDLSEEWNVIIAGTL